MRITCCLCWDSVPVEKLSLDPEDWKPENVCMDCRFIEIQICLRTAHMYTVPGTGTCQ